MAKQVKNMAEFPFNLLMFLNCSTWNDGLASAEASLALILLWSHVP